MSVRLRLFLLVTLAAMAAPLWLRIAPPDLEGALRQLLDGDADHDDRLRLLQVVQRQGLRADATDTRGQLLAAMAALELGDVAGYERAAATVAGRTSLLPGCPVSESDTDSLAELSFGMPYLRDLLSAHHLENQAHPTEAIEQLRRARRSAALFGAAAVVQVCDQALRRLHG